jgi:hypothetical protein
LDDLSSFQRPSHILGKHFSTFFALCCWHSFGNGGTGWSSDQKAQQSGIH